MIETSSLDQNVAYTRGYNLTLNMSDLAQGQQRLLAPKVDIFWGQGSKFQVVPISFKVGQGQGQYQSQGQLQGQGQI